MIMTPSIDRPPVLATVVIPRRHSGERHGLECALKLQKQLPELEVILVEGDSPARQRIAGAERSSGEILYFLDEDSEMNLESLHRGLSALNDNRVDVVGGVALLSEQATLVERATWCCLGCPFVAPFASSRYRPNGKQRAVSGEELILCNLMVRRDVFLASKQFDSAPYPGEEHDFLKELRARKDFKKTQIVYEPGMTVQKRGPRSFHELLRKVFSYGRGRSLHCCRKLTSYDLPYFAPFLFSIIWLLWLALCPISATVAAFGLLILSSLAFLAWGFLRCDAQPALAKILATCLAAPILVTYAAGTTWGICKHLVFCRSHNHDAKVKDEGFQITLFPATPK